MARAYPEGVAIQDIQNALGSGTAQRTLQHRLRRLVDEGRLIRSGKGRSTRYMPPVPDRHPAATLEASGDGLTGEIQLSAPATEIRQHLDRPLRARKPVAYRRVFLDEYRPNETG